MQYRHPMHRSESMSTTPSSVENVAPTGHTCTHGGCTQWLQSLGTKNVRSTSGSSCEVSFEALLFTLMLSTTTLPSFLITYRSPHGCQPMHLSISIPMP